MSAIRGHDTTPARPVRSALHHHGLRFRLHVRGLPGCPDIVRPRHRTVILMHGCFCYRHIGCYKSTLPTTNLAWWVAKLRRNRARDRRNIRDLRTAGWRVIVVWECELGVSRGTATERAARLERFGRSLVHKVTARHKHRHALNVTRPHTA